MKGGSLNWIERCVEQLFALRDAVRRKPNPCKELTP